MTLPKKWALCLALVTLIMLPFTYVSADASVGLAKSETDGQEAGVSTEAGEIAGDNNIAEDEGSGDGPDGRSGGESVFALESEPKASYIGGYEVGKAYRMKTTGYCSCKKCTGTSGASRTASGTWPKAKRTISMSGVPFGTRVKMGGITYVVEDRGGGVKGKHIDVYYSSHSTALKHGLKYMDAVILGKGGDAEKASTQPAQTPEPEAPAPTKEPAVETGAVAEAAITKHREFQ